MPSQTPTTAVAGSPVAVSSTDYLISYKATPNAAAVRAALGGDGSHRTIAKVLADANRPMAKLAAARRPTPDGLSPSAKFGFCWNTEDQADDRNFLWYPQGITTTADASSSRKYDGVEAVAVTWYRRRTRTDDAAVQSRVSLAPAGGAGSGRGRYRPHRLVVSAYLEEPGVALWRFDLDAVSHLPAPGPAADAYHLPFTHVQGATTRKDRFWFNSSGNGPKLRHWQRTGGAAPVAYRGTGGAESLSYCPRPTVPAACRTTCTRSPRARAHARCSRSARPTSTADPALGPADQLLGRWAARSRAGRPAADSPLTRSPPLRDVPAARAS